MIREELMAFYRPRAIAERRPDGKFNPPPREPFPVELLTDEEENYLDRHWQMLKNMATAWRERLVGYARHDVDPAWARERRREYLKSIISHLTQRIIHARIDLARESDPVVFIMIKNRIDGLVSEIKKRTHELENIEKWRSDSCVSGLPEEMIARARAYPIKNLLQSESGKDRINCPFHDDRKMSASIKTGVIHCFSCGESCDSIGYLMRIKNMDFVSAVKILSGG